MTSTPPRFTAVKEEPDEKPFIRKGSGSAGIYIGEPRSAAPAPTSGRLCLVKPKKERREVKREWTPPPEYKAKVLAFKAAADPEEYPGEAEAYRNSINDASAWSMDPEAAVAWSAADYRREQQRRARAVIDEAARRGFVIDLDDDEAGPSTDPKGKGLKEPKPEPPTGDDSDDDDDYTSQMYHRLGLGGDH